MVYVHYEGTEMETHEYSRNDANWLTLPFGLLTIITITAFTIDLNYNRFVVQLQRLLTHHFIEAQAAGGWIFTIEKNRTCILVQSCRPSPNSTPVVREFIRGKRRPRFETLRRVKTHFRPAKNNGQDILHWIHINDELEDLYDSNCQQFSLCLWGRLSYVPYPSMGIP